nr:BURP domain protein RD22-like [Ipomoea batatas]
METQVIIKIFLFLSLSSFVASHAALSAPIEAYWKSELPSTPMPQAVKESLPKAAGTVVSTGRNFGQLVKREPFFYKYAATEDELHNSPFAALYFKGDAFHKGNTINLQFMKATNEDVFLPRTEAEKIPFSSHEMAQILNRFSLKPNSEEAQLMKQTLESCEEPPIKGEEKYCATSLEAMVDFSKSNLGKKVGLITTETGGETSKQDYTISSIKTMQNKDLAVVCHKMNYAYAVFNCHKIASTEVYMVSLVGANGAKVKAAAVCHKDTLAFNPENFVFKVLNVKPGTVPVCHFLPEDHIVWIAN